MAAPEDLLWRYDQGGFPAYTFLGAYTPYSSVAETDDYLYSVYIGPSGNMRVVKTDKVTGASIFIEFVYYTSRHTMNYLPHIAADNNGVYVAYAADVPNDNSTATVYLVKLNPVDLSFVATHTTVNSPYFNTVSDLAIDATGVYVAGGSTGGWRVEKWDRALVGSEPLWRYTLAQSGGKAADFSGPQSITVENGVAYLAGHYYPTVGHAGLRLDVVSADTGTLLWKRNEGMASGVAGPLMVADGALFIAKQLDNTTTDYGVGYGIGMKAPSASYFERRAKSDGSVVWSVYTPGELTTALLDKPGTDTFYRVFVKLDGVAGFFNPRIHQYIYVDERSKLDGSKVSPVELVTETDGLNQYISSVGWPYPVENALADSTGIYILGTENVMLTDPFTPRISKFAHFGEVSGANLTSAITASGVYQVGSPIAVSSLVTNEGGVDAGAFVDQFAYSWDGGLTLTTVPEIPSGGLAAGGTQTDTSTVTPTQAGVLTLQHCVDIYNTVDEGSNEFPNCSGMQVVVADATVTGTGCTIAASSSSCDGLVSWNTSFVSDPQLVNTTSGTVCGTAVSGTNESCELQYGINTIELREGSAPLTATALTASCVAGSAWDSGLGMCVAAPPPPTVALTPTPSLVRSAGSTEMMVELDSAYTLACTIDGLAESAITFTHTANTLPATYTYTSDQLYSSRMVTISCTDGNVTAAAEVYVSVVPAAYES